METSFEKIKKRTCHYIPIDTRLSHSFILKQEQPQFSLLAEAVEYTNCSYAEV